MTPFYTQFQEAYSRSRIKIGVIGPFHDRIAISLTMIPFTKQFYTEYRRVRMHHAYIHTLHMQQDGYEDHSHTVGKWIFQYNLRRIELNDKNASVVNNK